MVTIIANRYERPGWPFVNVPRSKRVGRRAMKVVDSGVDWLKSSVIDVEGLRWWV